MHAMPSRHRRLTVTQWLIVSLAAIGFAFDIYELLMVPVHHPAGHHGPDRAQAWHARVCIRWARLTFLRAGLRRRNCSACWAAI